jgi:hypothetical protein
MKLTHYWLSADHSLGTCGLGLHIHHCLSVQQTALNTADMLIHPFQSHVSIPVQTCNSAHLQAINKYSTNPVQLWCPHKPQPMTLLTCSSPCSVSTDLIRLLSWTISLGALVSLPRSCAQSWKYVSQASPKTCLVLYSNPTAWSLGVLYVTCPCLTQWPAHWCA